MQVRSLWTAASVALVVATMAATEAAAQMRSSGVGASRNSGGSSVQSLTQGLSGGGSTAASGSGVSSIEQGVELQRRDRAARDLNQVVGVAPPTTGEFAAANGGGTGGAGRTGAGGLGLGGNQAGFSNLFNQMNRQGLMGGANLNQRNQLRIPLRLGFEMPDNATSQMMSASMNGPIAAPPQWRDRLQRALGSAVEGVIVEVEAGTVVLRGSVATEHQGKLAERMLLLEPRVSAVRNELLVAPPPTPELLPPPPALQ